MKTNSVKELPAFALEGYNRCEGRHETMEVSFQELRTAEVGTIWGAYDPTNCGRASFSEEAEMVYKNDQGCAILFRESATTDSPDPEYYESEPYLTWYEFN